MCNHAISRLHSNLIDIVKCRKPSAYICVTERRYNKINFSLYSLTAYILTQTFPLHILNLLTHSLTLSIPLWDMSYPKYDIFS